MTDYDSVDFFADASLLEDPYPYFDHLRSKCPVLPTPHHGVVAVSGYEEAAEIYLNPDEFSSCNSVIGPFAAFPVPLEGDDVGAHHRHLPRPAADVRAHGDDGPADAHARALPHHAAPDTEAPEGERGVHAASRRSADRRVHRSRESASSSARTRSRSRCSWSPTSSVCPRRTTSAFGRGFGMSTGPGSHRRRRRRHGRQRPRLARRGVRPLHRGPAARAPRRRPDRSGSGHLPRRVDART